MLTLEQTDLTITMADGRRKKFYACEDIKLRVEPLFIHIETATKVKRLVRSAVKCIELSSFY